VAPEKVLDQPVPVPAPPTGEPDNGGTMLTPAQKTGLDILRRNFEAGKISADEYQTDRNNILTQESH
jgi:hypothetical protein